MRPLRRVDLAKNEPRQRPLALAFGCAVARALVQLAN